MGKIGIETGATWGPLGPLGQDWNGLLGPAFTPLGPGPCLSSILGAGQALAWGPGGGLCQANPAPEKAWDAYLDGLGPYWDPHEPFGIPFGTLLVPFGGALGPAKNFTFWKLSKIR